MDSNVLEIFSVLLHYIACSSCNLGNIGQTRRQLKAKMDEYCYKVENEDWLSIDAVIIITLTLEKLM